jgi:hypothetical protein
MESADAQTSFSKIKIGKNFSACRPMTTAFIRHYSLSSADKLEIGLRRREHNRLGFAVQLCLMRLQAECSQPERLRLAQC